MESTTFVGLDVHKRTTSVAIAEPGRGGEVRFLGEIPSIPEALHCLALRLKGRHRRLSFCYEAEPCGYGVHRLLSGLGQECAVVAPSVIPSRPGDRVKTNRRDATTLAKLHRTGELTPSIGAPTPIDGCQMPPTRSCATWCDRSERTPNRWASARSVLGKARQHLQGFLLRHGRIYSGLRGWTKAYRRWLTTVRFDHPAQQIVLQDCIHAVEDAEAQLERIRGSPVLHRLPLLALPCAISVDQSRSTSVGLDERTSRSGSDAWRLGQRRARRPRCDDRAKEGARNDQRIRPAGRRPGERGRRARSRGAGGGESRRRRLVAQVAHRADPDPA